MPTQEQIIGKEETGEGVLEFGERQEDGTRFERFTPTPRTTVGMVDTGSAIRQVNQQKQFLDSVAPERPTQVGPTVQQPVSQPAPGVQQPVEPVQPAGKAFFVNESGQEAEYTQEQLEDPRIQSFLRDQGFVLSKSEGVSVSPDFTVAGRRGEVAEVSNQIEDPTNDFISYRVEDDPEFQEQARQIRAEFERVRKQMQRTNDQRKKAFETLGFRTGSAQFAGAIQMGIEGEELRQANQRMSDIAREESAAISAANAAFRNQEFEGFSRTVDALRGIREQKAEELANYNEVLTNFSAKLAEQEKNSLEERKFALDVLKYEDGLKAKAKPISLSPGQVLFDPDTGEEIASVPKPIDMEAPSIQRWGNMVHQWNPIKGSWDTIGVDEAPGVYSDSGGEIIDWANSVAAGERKFSDVPNDLKSKVNSAMQKLPPKREDVSKFQQKIDDLEGLKTHHGKDRAVGVFGIARFTPLKADKASRNELLGILDRIISEETLQSLINAKADGATFGALSEGELRILETAATTLRSWAKDSDGDGQTNYYEIDEKSFDREVDRLIEQYNKVLEETAGETTATTTVQQRIDDYYLQNPDQRELIDTLDTTVNPDTGKIYTDTEKMQILGVPTASVEVSSAAPAIMAAIGTHESGNNYTARGKDGEIGKYQIMPNNYIAWAREAGVDPKDKSPDAQETIARHKIQQYLATYDNDPVAVAIAWNAGPGRANEYVRTGKVPELVGTSAGGGRFNVPNYVQSVLRNMNTTV